MKFLVCLVLSLIMYSGSVFATAQAPDLLVYQGETVRIYSNPLEGYFNNSHPRPNELFRYSCSAIWRGYVATWEIKNDFLYLIRLREGNCSADALEIPLSRLFPGQELPIKAIWFSGELIVPKGKLLQYVHMGYGSTYEKELRLTIQAAKLVKQVEIDNTKKRVPGVEKQTHDVLRKLEQWERQTK